MTGLHITADLYECNCANYVLIEPGHFLQHVKHSVERAGLTALQDCTYCFPQGPAEQGGFTSVVLLAESHVSVHTWPERRYVSMDAYVCNHSNDNSNGARGIVSDLLGLFEPSSTERSEIWRGYQKRSAEDANPQSLHLEWLNATAAFGFRAKSVLERRQSAYQFIEVLDCPQWGRTLRLDGRYMTSEAEGFIYHELMVHPVMAAHRAASSILVVGGGDGGALRELLRYAIAQPIDLVEIDPDVIEVSKQHLRSINNSAFDDPKVRIHVSDAQSHMIESHRTYDIILLDLTDERPPAAHLYDRQFFALLRTRLNKGGAIVLHCGSPYYDPISTESVLNRVRAEFSIVRPFGAYIPLYGSYLLFAVASQSLDVQTITESDVRSWIETNNMTGLRYYAPEMHRALFSIPPFLQAALNVA